MTTGQIKQRIEDIYPLSPMQQGMLFHALLNPDSPVYFERSTMTLEGDLDIEVLRKAWAHLGKTHPLLRTIFRWKGVNEPVQIVLRDRGPEFNVHDISTFDKGAQEKRIAMFLVEDRRNKFDLAKGPLMRLNVLLLAPKKFFIIWSYHHILIDGWCQSLVLNDLFLSYMSIVGAQVLPEIKRPPYKQYIAWLKQQDKAAAERYWKEKLHDFRTPTTLPTENKPHDRSGFALATHTVWLSKELTSTLQETARKIRVTLSTLVQGAWAILLNRHSGQDDVVFGVTISGRPADIPGSDQMIGLFINSLPVRVRFDTSPTVRSLMQDLQAQSLKIQEYGFSFLPDVKACSAVPGAAGLFNSIVIFENFPTSYKDMGIGTAIRITDSKIEEMTNFDFTLFIIPGTELELTLHYATDLFAQETIEHLLGHLPVILTGMLQALDEPVSTLDILTGEERKLLVEDFNATGTEYEHDKCAYQLFEEQVEVRPDDVAVVFGDRAVTYRELNIRANQLARLLRGKGVKPDHIVGILVERSMEMLIGLLGILKAGGAYLPLDPMYPEERIRYMLEDSRTKILLTQQRCAEKIERIKFDGEIIDIFDEGMYVGENSNLEPVNSTQDLMYVIYTSGSTGRPKGVMLEHRNVVNFIKGMTEIVDFSTGKTIVCLTTISFDIFVLETHLALAMGLKVVMASEQEQNDPELLKNLIIKNNITMLQTTPSRLKLLMASSAFVASMQGLKEIMVGGEPFPENMLKPVQDAMPHGRIYDVYGPTETAVWSTVKDLTGAESINIGRPIANTQIYIIDKYGRLQPRGILGELCIGGDGLARGYLNREDLTAEKFVPTPFGSGSKMYKTGDLARWLNNGDLECHGRVDYQVKIRGNRIELGEIETCLAELEAIRDVVVVDKDDKDGNKYLVAYYVADDDIQPVDLRASLKERLPEYMIPSRYIRMEVLPLTPNGKVDRKALPEPDGLKVAVETEHIAPRNEIEHVLAELWQEVLGVEKVGIKDNFFDLGGHSMLIMKVLARLHFSYPLTVQDFFDHQTIMELSAKAMERMGAPQVAPTQPLAKETKTEMVVNIPISGEKEHPQAILLTGVTGYLGAHLLYELLRQTDARISCLIRGENEDEAALRLRSTMDFYFGDKAIDLKRVTPVLGDIGRDGLGLQPDCARKLHQEVDTIVHSAADVRHYGEYAHFQNVNVLGTKRLLDLATQGICRRFHYISTLGVSGEYVQTMTQIVFKETDYDRGQEFGNVYARSKYEAEGLVQEAIKGGLKATIYRVGILVGETATGRFQKAIETNAFYGLLKGIIQLGTILDDPEGFLEMTPVDACREAIVQLMLLPETAGRQFHLYNPNYISFSALTNYLQSFGYSIKTLPVGEYLKALTSQREGKATSEALENLVPHLAGSSRPKTRVVYDNSLTRHFLDAAGFIWPELNERLVHKLIAYCVSTGFIDQPVSIRQTRGEMH